MKVRGLFATFCLFWQLLAGPGGMAFLCSMDGGVHAEPCCPVKTHAEAAAGDHAPVAGGRSCCELSAREGSTPPAAAERAQRSQIEGTAVLLSRAHFIERPVFSPQRRVERTEPDPRGPPLFLRHRVFLL